MNLNKALGRLKDNSRFVVFRTDRIGDLILSIPAIYLIKQKYKNSKITFVVRKYTAKLLENNEFVDEVICIDNETILSLQRKLKNYDVAIYLFSSFSITISGWLARIPLRIGPMSKWWGIFYNVRVRQKRSQIKKHELDYNLELINKLDIDINDKIDVKTIFLIDEEIKFRNDFYEKLNLDSKKLIILHPGSGNSAKNWPVLKYLDLAYKLKDNKDVKVIIFGENKEREEYLKLAQGKYEVLESMIVKSVDIRKYCAIISGTRLFVSNSTGPLHIASSQGIQTISFYCPIKVCNPKRWGPYPHNDSNYVFMPDVPECAKCVGSKCEYFNCMDRIEVDSVVKKINEMLEF